MLSQIDGVLTRPFMTIPDDRGMVLKIDTPTFPVKDVYCTTVRHGAVKAWHGYDTKKLSWTVISGLVQLVLYDNRPKSMTYEVTDTLFLGVGSYFSIEVPPGVFNGFKGISQEDAIILVQASEVYGQITRWPYDTGEIGYNWDTKHG
jgi:dTDP-4-dehydrorhamnose 3,5-epimerase